MRCASAFVRKYVKPVCKAVRPPEAGGPQLSFSERLTIAADTTPPARGLWVDVPATFRKVETWTN